MEIVTITIGENEILYTNFFSRIERWRNKKKKKGKNSTNFVYYILSLSRLDFQYSLSPIRINFIDIQLIYTWPY